MGNHIQKESPNRCQKEQLVEKGRPKKLPEDILTDEEIDNIQQTWPHLKKHIIPILTQAFLELFTENPDVKDKFLGFRNYTISDLQRHEKEGENALQRHVPRVARAVVKVVSHVGNLDDVLDYLECVGKIHQRNGIMNHEMIALGPFFVSAAVQYLPSKLRSRQDIQDSWIRLFMVMTELMKRGAGDVEFELSDDEKTHIRRTFHLLKANLKELGTATFINLFQNYSTSKMFFPTIKDSPLEDLTLNEALQNHGLRLMKVIENVIADIDNPRQVDIYLAQLGQMHQTMGLEKKYLDVMGPIFCQSIRSVLQEEGEWSMDIRHAWLHLFRVMVIKMKRGFKTFPEISPIHDTEEEDEDDHQPQQDHHHHHHHNGETLLIAEAKLFNGSGEHTKREKISHNNNGLYRKRPSHPSETRRKSNV